GGEEDRVFLAHVVDGRAIVGDVEARLAVGEIERAGAFSNRVVTAGLEEARRAGVIGDGLARAIVVRRARPEDAEVLFDLLVRDAGVIRDATFAGDAQLFEDLAWAVEGEAVRTIQRAGDVLDDDPI